MQLWLGSHLACVVLHLKRNDVTTGQRFPVVRVTPGELIAGSVGGVTDIAPDRCSRRRITLQVAAFVHLHVRGVTLIRLEPLPRYARKLGRRR